MYDQVDTGVGTVAEYDDNTYAEYDTGYTDQEYDTSLMDQEAGGISGMTIYTIISISSSV